MRMSRIAAALAVCLPLVLVNHGGGGVAAAAGPDLTGLAVDLSQVQPGLCANLGGTSPEPTSVTDLPGGGVSYNYAVDDSTVSYPVPPAGFQPLTASDELLEAYGFPPRPAEAEALAGWQAQMTGWKAMGMPELCQTDIRADVKAVPPVTVMAGASGTAGSTLYYANWAGYEGRGYRYAAVQGDFVQPRYYSCGCSGDYEVSWTGIGDGPGLIQDGTDLHRGAPYAWYDWLDSTHARGEQVMPNVRVNVGDHIHTYTAYASSQLRLNFYVADNTTGTSQSVILSNVPTSYWDPTVFEAIDERPTVGGLPPLSNFGTVSWSNVQGMTTGGSWRGVGQDTYVKVIMQGSKVLAQPGGLSTNYAFVDYWKACC